jgi:hypothetical protein
MEFEYRNMDTRDSLNQVVSSAATKNFITCHPCLRWRGWHHALAQSKTCCTTIHVWKTIGTKWRMKRPKEGDLRSMGLLGTNSYVWRSKSLLLIKVARVVYHFMFCHYFCSVIPVLPSFSFFVLCFSFPCYVIILYSLIIILCSVFLIPPSP